MKSKKYNRKRFIGKVFASEMNFIEKLIEESRFFQKQYEQQQRDKKMDKESKKKKKSN